ncbi:ceramide kinase isoform X2 [Scaptodrosophila lebanonensis]|nr:ceramide kinase isoform X2 [Scaptodrosophila lebanonensis]
MTQSSSTEFAKKQQHEATTAVTTKMPPNHAASIDVLLNNFQFKKKSYRVLLNGQHFVWERLKQTQSGKKQHKAAPQEPTGQSQSGAQTKETESDQLSNGSSTLCYGPDSHVLHLDDIINVRKGDTKQATLKPPSTPMSSEDENNELSTSVALKPTAQYLTINYAERLLKSATDCNRWQVRRLTLYNSDPYIVDQWYRQLKERLYCSAGRLRVRRLLVFINPYGGRKAGLQTYERHCKPLFQLAGIDVTCITTQRANQIRDILLSHDLSVYDAVCCIGGDGTVAEVINGLIFRTMRELGLDEQRPAYIPKPMMPVGIIPAGSTDTIAYSMHGTADVRTAAIHVLLGQRRGLDVSSVRNSQTLLRFCASILSYGYLGDVAAKSEQYRWMGAKRYEYTGVKAFINNRGYEAELRFLLDEDGSEQQEQPERCESPQSPSAQSLQRALSVCSVGNTSVCYANCQRCSFAASLQDQPSVLFGSTGGETDDDEEERPNLPYDGSTEQPAATPRLSTGDAALLPPQRPRTLNLQGAQSLTSSLNFGSPTSTTAQWKSIKGNFFMICGANITCACSRSPNGISRYSHLGDGYLDLILVRKTSLLNNVRFLLNTAGRDGDIRNLPFVEVYRTRKFNFRTLTAAITSPDEGFSINGSCQPITEPSDANSTQLNEFSSWNCDGEVVTDLDITMSSHCQLIDVFMRGPHSYNKPRKSGAGPSTVSGTATTPASSNDNVYCCCKD